MFIDGWKLCCIVVYNCTIQWKVAQYSGRLHDIIDDLNLRLGTMHVKTDKKMRFESYEMMILYFFGFLYAVHLLAARVQPVRRLACDG